ncbi:MAG: hypothetical protein HC803_00665 [Saprospiraceae bacterium]|nr:hypothetical protein [Saprospiraceae bacterium]
MGLAALGTVWFSSRNIGNTLTTSHLHFDKSIVFQGKGGNWTLMDSISVFEIKFSEGSLFSNSHSIRVGTFQTISSLATVDTLDLYHSNIYPYLDESILKFILIFQVLIPKFGQI